MSETGLCHQFVMESKSSVLLLKNRKYKSASFCDNHDADVGLGDTIEV